MILNFRKSFTINLLNPCAEMYKKYKDYKSQDSHLY